jgi:hypothetical protein
MQNMQFFTAKGETTTLSDTLAQAYILCHNREEFCCEILKRQFQHQENNSKLPRELRFQTEPH